jgi:hypothetical protein
MGTTTPSQDRSPAWLPTAEIPLQRQAPPVLVAPAAPRTTSRTPLAVPRPRRGRPISTYLIAAGLVVGTMGALDAVQATRPEPTTRAVARGGGYVANVSVPGRVLTSFGDGTWQIGVDVEPGTYATAGAVDPTCHHALRRTRTGGDSIGAADGPGPATVVLREADGWFETSGCATWKRAG